MPLSRLEIKEADAFKFLLEFKYGYVWDDAVKNELPGVLEFNKIGAITALSFDLLKLEGFSIFSDLEDGFPAATQFELDANVRQWVQDKAWIGGFEQVSIDDEDADTLARGDSDLKSFEWALFKLSMTKLVGNGRMFQAYLDAGTLEGFPVRDQNVINQAINLAFSNFGPVVTWFKDNLSGKNTFEPVKKSFNPFASEPEKAQITTQFESILRRFTTQASDLTTQAEFKPMIAYIDVEN